MSQSLKTCQANKIWQRWHLWSFVAHSALRVAAVELGENCICLLFSTDYFGCTGSRCRLATHIIQFIVCEIVENYFMTKTCRA